MVIASSGVEYEVMTADDMVVVRSPAVRSLKQQNRRPIPVHLALYRRYPQIGGSFIPIPAMRRSVAGRPRSARSGTTHADYSGGAIPCTRRPDDR